MTGFTMKPKKFGEEINGTGTKFFIHLSSKLKKHIFAGIIENDGGKYYNSFVHFDPNGLITARYRKIHPFTKEAEYFCAGADPVITKIDNLSVGLAVCYDLSFPELYRMYAKKKVDILITAANWPVPRIHHWTHLLRSRAIENQCFSIGVNRTGNDPANEYNGQSAAFDPAGDEITSAGSGEQIFSFQIEPEKITEVREKLNFLDDICLI